MYHTYILYVMYIDWNTCIGVRASANKLTTLMTLQCNENNSGMQCTYISSVRYVTHNYSKAYVCHTSNQVLMGHFFLLSMHSSTELVSIQSPNSMCAFGFLMLRT